MAKRNNPLLVAVFLLAFSLVWFGIGLVHVWSWPVLGWLPLPIMSLLAAHACARIARQRSLTRSTRRFWGQLAAACGVLTLAIVANAVDAVGGPAPTLRIGTVAMLSYLVVCVMVLCSLLALPTWKRTRGDWARFALDAGIVLITTAELIWHFSFRSMDLWMAQTGSIVPLLAIGTVCSVAMVAFVKVAFAGAGQLDRGALRILAAGAAVSAAGSGVTPFLSERPYLSSCFVAAPLAILAVHVAAQRQLMSSTAPPTERPVSRRFSVVPYLAVATTNALLLTSDTVLAGEGRIMASCAVGVTALVVMRQITALLDNGRLLRTVDANLRQLRAYQRQLAHQVSHDTLTEIANRSLFEEKVTEHLNAGERFHIALLDLDDFKVVNDRLGHSTGDALLRAISRRLLENVRQEDIVARLGGDEFTLLLPGLDDDEADAVLRRVIDVVQLPILLGSQEMVARISIGITASEPGDSPEELIRRADVAMYSAKTSGGGRRAWFDPIMDRLAAADARLGSDLRQAIAHGELTVLYQPIVELPNGRLAGVEALLRWTHPELGPVSPATFIPLAERNGYIVELGRWVLEQVVQQAATWQRRWGAAGPEKVSVNISARQLQEPGFAAEVGELIARAGLDPSLLVAEVTETAVLGTGQALAAVRELHDLGLRVALDDFGTGQSSLSLLVDCPVNVLKVDKSFVDGIVTSGPEAVIVDKIIGITDGLSIQAVAEGVETAAQAHRLHEAGYRYAQGFHFARPMPGSAIDQLIAPAALVTPN